MACRTGIVLGAAAFFLACSAAESGPNVAGQAAASVTTDAPIPRADVERDLVLETVRGSMDAMDHERDPKLEVWLANRSQTASYPVVLSNDGSESGWREPHAYFKTEILNAAGTWVAANEARGVRCGLYARDWENDIIVLPPGGRVKMPWMPYSRSELADSTRVRITAHYEYGAQSRDKNKVPPQLHAMPSYAIRSAPLDIPVEHPYRLTLSVTGALPRTPKTPLGNSVEVFLENHSGRQLPFGTSQSGSQLWFEVQVANRAADADSPDSLFLDTAPTYAAKDTIDPGARKSLVTPATKTDVVWELPSGKITKLRALYRVWDGSGETGNQRRVESAWVDVPNEH